MICVYSANETVFSNNGLATLEPTLCELTMTINGAWILTLEHPYDLDGKYLNLEKGNIIKVTDIGILRGCDTTQRYRIYDTVKGLSSMKVIALPVGMEATYDAIIEELNIKAKTGNQAVALLSSYLTNHGVSKYTLTASGLSKKRTTKYKNTNLIASLCSSDDGSIVNKYGAEVAYNNYQIFIKSHIGNTTPQYDVRIGKNLTGLSYDTDDSAVVTRLYPISDDDIRYNSFDTGTSGDKSYYDAENINDYPFIRAAFVDAPYSLIDTDISDDNPYKTDTTDLTEEIYNTVYNDGEAAIQAFWADVCTDNVFEYTHESETSVIYLIPEFVQDVISEISTTIAENVLNDAGVIHEGLRSWLTKAIRASLGWVTDVDLPDKAWIENQDGSYSYGTELRKLENEWAYVDRKMSWFGSDTKWVKEKDDEFDWDWVQKKGQRQKYGNNKRYLARNTYIYDYDDECKYYWFDDEGWWDGSSESSGWAWHQDSTGWWFGDADPDGDESKYIHDDWAFIRETSSSARKLYYFDSDGYLDDSKTETVDWNWHQVNGKWYFGSTNHENRATYLVSQWMKIDGDYYYFDSNGYVVDLKDTMMGLAEVLSFYLSDVLIDAIQGGQNDLYNCLYAHMKDYCDDLYDNGLCDPTINVSIDFVDLSMTEEYKDFSALEKVCLGDRVKVIYNLYGNTQYSIEEYVKGLTYDCIRGYNTKIEVGGVSSVTSLFDTSVKGTGNEQRLVAGENVTINGNVINVSANTGDVYAGDKVSVTQLQTTGQPIAKIYVNGTPTTIYAVGSDVEVEPIKTEGDKIATITVGGVDYDIYADTGLKYWVETETDIYRTGQRTGLKGDAGYYREGTTWGSSIYHYKTSSNLPVIIGNYYAGQRVIAVSPYEDAVNILYQRWYSFADWQFWGYYDNDFHEGWGQPAIDEPELYKPLTHYYDFNYEGVHWYGMYMQPWDDDNKYFNFDSYSDYQHESSYTETAALLYNSKSLIDTAHASGFITDIVGISNQDHILYYNNDKEGNYDTANRSDAVYISKDGIFNGKEFRVNGETMGGFYKTNLYLGTTYSATISLSKSYTDFDMLMIETYNADDKKNLASIVNVSDLSNASYVGVDGYLMYTITNGRTLTFHEAPSDTNHSRYIKAVYGLRTSHESGEIPPLEDVIVDGVSVVSGSVAVIDLTGKQDALTVGANINITNGVISATDTTYSDFTGSSHGLVPAIQTQSGKYLKDDGSWDTPSGGGTTVVANPSETATDTLSKIQIASTIYSIVGGGCGLDVSEFDNWWHITTNNTDQVSISDGDVYSNSILITKSDYNSQQYDISKSEWITQGLICTGYDANNTQHSMLTTIDTIQELESYVIVNYKVYNLTGVTIISLGTMCRFAVPKEGNSGGGGASDLDDLGDVNISSPSNGQVLTYNSTSQKWENANASGGGGGGVSYGYNIPSSAGTDGQLYMMLNSSDELKAMYLNMNGTWILIDGTPYDPVYPVLVASVQNTDSGSSATVNYTYSGSETITTDNFLHELTSYYFSGSNKYICSTNFTSYVNNTLTYEWTTQSGSTCQWFDIYFVEDLSKLHVLSSWTTYDTDGEYIFTLPSGVTAESVIIDFKEVNSGGADMERASVIKSQSERTLKIKFPFPENNTQVSFKARVLYLQ